MSETYPRIAQIKWITLYTLRPPLTAEALREWVCPYSVLVTDDSFWTGTY